MESGKNNMYEEFGWFAVKKVLEDIEYYCNLSDVSERQVNSMAGDLAQVYGKKMRLRDRLEMYINNICVYAGSKMCNSDLKRCVARTVYQGYKHKLEIVQGQLSYLVDREARDQAANAQLGEGDEDDDLPF